MSSFLIAGSSLIEDRRKLKNFEIAVLLIVALGISLAKFSMLGNQRRNAGATFAPTAHAAREVPVTRTIWPVENLRCVWPDDAGKLAPLSAAAPGNTQIHPRTSYPPVRTIRRIPATYALASIEEPVFNENGNSSRGELPAPVGRSSPARLPAFPQGVDPERDDPMRFQLAPASGNSSGPLLFPSPDAGSEIETTTADVEIQSLLWSISNQRLIESTEELRWSLDDVIMAVLVYSHQAQALMIEPLESLQDIGVEVGQFDAAAFVETRFLNASRPVGTTFDVAGTNIRIQERDDNFLYGIRKQTVHGGTIELSQNHQLLDNDSGILNPPNQANSSLNLRATQELLRGSGRSIAMNEVIVATHNAHSQHARSVGEIAGLVEQVAVLFWEIYATRGELLVALESRSQGEKVLQELEARANLDASQNLIYQTKAAIQQRQILVNQARNRLHRSQFELISLVNAPELLNNTLQIEILPQFDANLQPTNVDVPTRVSTALHRRPEVEDVVQEIHAAKAQNHFSLNQLMPRLTLSVESSLNGLAGDRGVRESIRDQFSSDPTYELGLNLEVPIHNRVARFTKRQTELRVARLTARWQSVLETVKSDVLTSAQDFNGGQQEFEGQLDVLRNSFNEYRFLQIRKRRAPRENSNPSFDLTQLLAAQDRLFTSKAGVARAITTRQQALVALNRATGILVQPHVIPLDSGPARHQLLCVFHQYEEGKRDFGRTARQAQHRVKSASRRSINTCACGKPECDCGISPAPEANVTWW